ncbi:RtcB family protein [Hyphomonas chukchiensis]|uniref:3'-phosphate/5'-hydroxy nucleic acid ligase n=1 Tax=Hyphomonas chukchiensis TaxID=1280947 RepID=A0A062UQB2_9PROT|nr:RtcB family protein [Hyphomonas chukchiensis]KCZ59007.1 RTCB protein [Hyphomonas chukchiensis]
MSEFDVFETSAGGRIKAWIKGVPVEEGARRQLENVAGLPFVHSHLAVMPDVHFGRGATVGSVIPTKGAIIPAAVGVDIGCGMMAIGTSLTANDLPDSLAAMRSEIERKVPVGNGRAGSHKEAPARAATALRNSGLVDRLEAITSKHKRIQRTAFAKQLGSLGGGNHFIELCLDEADHVWVMLHSGSRGTGNVIGTYFIQEAREALEKRVLGYHVPDRDLAFFVEGEDLFADYIYAVGWAQDYARLNREVMMDRVLIAMREMLPPFTLAKQAVNCHHNYVEQEHHFGADVWVTRKGAVRAGAGELGIIPGSMGAKSFIVRGKGNAESFCSCSHGAGRVMSRSDAKRRFTLEDHIAATAAVECRKDAGVIDETPMAYKDIDAVMAAQADLVEVIHTLRQVVCVKG